MSETVYLNGEFIPAEEAKISPNDRGFIFADGVYEVIKYYNGKPFRYSDHMKRLERSLSEISIRFSDLGKYENIFQKLLMLNDLNNIHAGVYLQITRGVNRRVHFFPENIQPAEYAFAFELPSFSEQLTNGIKVITQEDIRWLRC
ncbi:MAG: aminotransferase class IV, partial [Prolixibacteraceae bacterium]|nr:aminotransferase class IV [Prolixibacteraceae bacterium]